MYSFCTKTTYFLIIFFIKLICVFNNGSVSNVHFLFQTKCSTDIILNLNKLTKNQQTKIISLQKRYEHLSIEVIQNKFVQKEKKKTENILLRHYVIFLNKNHHPLDYI